MQKKTAPETVQIIKFICLCEGIRQSLPVWLNIDETLTSLFHKSLVFTWSVPMCDRLAFLTAGLAHPGTSDSQPQRLFQTIVPNINAVCDCVWCVNWFWGFSWCVLLLKNDNKGVVEAQANIFDPQQRAKITAGVYMCTLFDTGAVSSIESMLCLCATL